MVVLEAGDCVEGVGAVGALSQPSSGVLWQADAVQIGVYLLMI